MGPNPQETAQSVSQEKEQTFTSLKTNHKNYFWKINYSLFKHLFGIPEWQDEIQVLKCAVGLHNIRSNWEDLSFLKLTF